MAVYIHVFNHIQTRRTGGARWGRKAPFWWRGEVHHTSVHRSMANSIRRCFEFGSWTRRPPTCYHRLVQCMKMFVLSRSLTYPQCAIISIRCQQQNWLSADTYKLLMLYHTMHLYYINCFMWKKLQCNGTCHDSCIIHNINERTQFSFFAHIHNTQLESPSISTQLSL